MMTILATVEVVLGREEHFEALWRQERPRRDQNPGLRTTRLLRETTQPGRYIVYGEWETREQYDAFARASGILWLLDATDHWMAPPRWSYCEDVEEATPTA